MPKPVPVVLVSLDWRRPKDPKTGLGTASIAAALRARGVPTQIVYDHVNRLGFRVSDVRDRIERAIRAAGPGCIVGIGAFVWNEPEVQVLMAWLANEDVFVVLGGPQVSYCAADQPIAEYPGADAFVRGHGEAAMVDLALGTAVSGVNGLHIVGQVDGNHRARLSLDALPSPHLDGTTATKPFVRWETQRGCPFRCSFCQHRDPNDRYRPQLIGQDRLFSELELFARSGVERIAVLDPIFHADEAHAVAVLEHAARVGLTATLSLQCRFEMLTDAFLDAAQAVNVELEFGLQTAIVDEGKAVQRHNNMDKVSDAIERLHARHMPFEVSLIYGLPTQTLASFEQSVAWCQSHRVPIIDAWPLMLLRGTPLEAQREKYGLVESTGERIPLVVQSHTFSRDDHAQMGRIADSLQRSQLTPALLRAA